MDKQEFIGKLNSVYVGENNAIDEIISEYDRLNNIINEIEKELNKILALGILSQKQIALNLLDKLKELKKGN